LQAADNERSHNDLGPATTVRCKIDKKSTISQLHDSDLGYAAQVPGPLTTACEVARSFFSEQLQYRSLQT